MAGPRGCTATVRRCSCTASVRHDFPKFTNGMSPEQPWPRMCLHGTGKWRGTLSFPWCYSTCPWFLSALPPCAYLWRMQCDIGNTRPTPMSLLQGGPLVAWSYPAKNCDVVRVVYDSRGTRTPELLGVSPTIRSVPLWLVLY